MTVFNRDDEKLYNSRGLHYLLKTVKQRCRDFMHKLCSNDKDEAFLLLFYCLDFFPTVSYIFSATPLFRRPNCYLRLRTGFYSLHINLNGDGARNTGTDVKVYHHHHRSKDKLTPEVTGLFHVSMFLACNVREQLPLNISRAYLLEFDPQVNTHSDAGANNFLSKSTILLLMSNTHNSESTVFVLS